MNEGFVLLSEEGNDVREGKNRLFEVIEEMDEEMRKGLCERLSEMGGHFECVLEGLFGGGRGEVKVRDGKDLVK
ncbi:hypothetical protein [Bacillus altitudinis]|uniref:hypothetical protein n=1 Tax=Bacillus altitudinis TaxID=293387 RepID=UPI0011A610BD|nr:hypothetical protein [Bacillus altitudinis]